MPSIIRINVVADLGPLLNIQRYSVKNRPTLIRTAANRYLKYLHNRYISLSSGSSSGKGGQWRKLTRKTVTRKRQRGIADNPRAILREYDELISQLDIGVINGITYVGYIKNKKHPRGNTVHDLVLIHADDGREIVVLPGDSVKKRMIDDIKNEYNKIIRIQKRGK